MRIVTLNTWKNEGDYPRRLGLMSDGLAAMAWANTEWAGALVVAGDLNATARCPELAALRAAVAPSTLQSPHADGPPHEGLAIDHCCLVQGRAWRVVARHAALDQPDLEGFRPSDHMAVVLDLEPA